MQEEGIFYNIFFQFGTELAYETEKKLVSQKKISHLMKRETIIQYDSYDKKILLYLLEEIYSLLNPDANKILNKYFLVYREGFEKVFLREKPKDILLMVKDLGIHAAMSEKVSHTIANFFRHEDVPLIPHHILTYRYTDYMQLYWILTKQNKIHTKKAKKILSSYENIYVNIYHTYLIS